MTAGSIAGTGSYVLGGKNLTVGGNNLSTTVSGVISGVGGSLTKVGTGTLNRPASIYRQYQVSSGTLSVNGSIAPPSKQLWTAERWRKRHVNNLVVGGTLPRRSIGLLTVQGTLLRILDLFGGCHPQCRRQCGGPALGGEGGVQPGSYVDRQYTISTRTRSQRHLQSTVVTNNANLTATLSYDPNDVFLNIKLAFNPPGGPASISRTSPTLTNFFNTTGIPAAATLNAAGLTTPPANSAPILDQAVTCSSICCSILHCRPRRRASAPGAPRNMPPA